MARLVMKFGGTSVADLDRIRNVARHVKREVDAGYDVAVVAFNYKSPKRVAQAMQEASQKGIGLIAMKTQSPDYLDAQGTIGTAPDHSKALDWVLSKDFIAAAIPGMTTRDQVDLNLKVMRAVS